MSEPLVPINLSSLPANRVDEFVASWEANTAAARGATADRPSEQAVRGHD